MNISNLTYAERARFADNDELRDALERCAELEAENERLVERIWDLEDALDKVTT